MCFYRTRACAGHGHDAGGSFHMSLAPLQLANSALRITYDVTYNI